MSAMSPSVAVFDSPVGRADASNQVNGLGQCLGRAFTVIKSGPEYVFDRTCRLFKQTEGVDKFARLVSSVIFAAQVHIKTTMPISIALLSPYDAIKHFSKSFSDTVAGIRNLPNRISEFTTLNKEGNVAFLQKNSAWKISSRIALVVSGICDTLILIRYTDLADLSNAAAAIGRLPIVGTFTLSVVRHTFVGISSSLAIVDYCINIANDKESKKLKLNIIGLLNEMGKVALITISQLTPAAVFTYGFAALCIVANSIAILKVVESDADKEAKDKADEAKAKEAEEAEEKAKALRTPFSAISKSRIDGLQCSPKDVRNRPESEFEERKVR